MNRPTEYRRHERSRHINRKKKIIKDQGGYWYYTHEGVLNKGKIHCSCWMCRRKSYDNAKMQDLRHVISDISKLEDLGIGGNTVEYIVNRTKTTRRMAKGQRFRYYKN